RAGEALIDLIDVIEGRADPIRLVELLAEPAVETSLTPAAETPRADLVPALLSEEAELGDFATVLTEPSVLTSPERNRMLRLLGVGEPEGGFAAAAEAHRERTRGYIDAV